MRKIIYLFLILMITGLIINPAEAINAKAPQNAENVSVDVDCNDVKETEACLIKKVSIKDKLQRTPEAQIKSFYKNFNKYSDKENFEKLKLLYSDKFVNNDGLTKDIIFKFMEESANTYKNVKYTTEIKDIKVSGFYASVSAEERAIGETAKGFKEIPGVGSVESYMKYTDYLVKENGKWKILSTNMLH